MGGDYTVSEQLKYWRSSEVNPAEVTSLARQAGQLLLLLSEQLAKLVRLPSNVQSSHTQSAGKIRNFVKSMKGGRGPAGRAATSLSREEPAGTSKSSSTAHLPIPMGHAKWVPMKQQVMAMVASSFSLQETAATASNSIAPHIARNTRGAVQLPSPRVASLQHSTFQLASTVSASSEAEFEAVSVSLARRLLPTAYALLLTMQANDARVKSRLATSLHQAYKAGKAMSATQGACNALFEIVESVCDAPYAGLVAACGEMRAARFFNDAASGLHLYIKAMQGECGKKHLKLVRHSTLESCDVLML